LPTHSIAWGDADGDGYLDLLAGNDGVNELYLNLNGQLQRSPSWYSDEDDNTRSVAWGYLDDDPDLDFAVGNDGQPVRVYRNKYDNTFDVVWRAPYTYTGSTYSVAWGDYDRDGDVDLAVGNYGQANYIYENLSGTLSLTPTWTSEEISFTTSLAWGDWDNDGDLDLAVGNDGERDQVYLNRDSSPGRPRLDWLWSSQELSQTTGLAWGDRDRDGDLDLAISAQDGIGYYENTYIMPSHLSDDFAATVPLPSNPSYLSIERPGATDNAYFYSSSDILGGPDASPAGTVNIVYYLFDPDGTRVDSAGNPPGDDVISAKYQYSLDGGGTWHNARITPISVDNDTRRYGEFEWVRWDARHDKAVSDDARFRITIVYGNQTGPIQRASTSAVSPPFRVRATECIWPEKPQIRISQDETNPYSFRFYGSVIRGTGVLTYTWDFGDDEDSLLGQEVRHQYQERGNYVVTLMVTSESCPISKTVGIHQTIYAGPILDKHRYFPFIWYGEAP
jgi:hypothetical protein